MKSFKCDSDSSNSQELHVRTNETVAIEIEGAGTTGYLWEVAKRPPALEVVRHSIEPNLETFGGAGKDRFEVRANRPGNHAFTLKLKAPWENTAAKVVKLTITADKPSST